MTMDSHSDGRIASYLFHNQTSPIPYQGSPTKILESCGFLTPTPVVTNLIQLFNQLIITIRWLDYGWSENLQEVYHPGTGLELKPTGGLPTRNKVRVKTYRRVSLQEQGWS